MVVPPLAGQGHLALPFGKASPVGLREALQAVAAAHPLLIAGQGPILGGQG